MIYKKKKYLCEVATDTYRDSDFMFNVFVINPVAEFLPKRECEH